MNWQLYLAERGFGQDDIAKLEALWNAHYRFYHTETNHLVPMFESLLGAELSEPERETLILTAIFHDAIYDPRSRDKEEQSCALFEEMAARSRLAGRRELVAQVCDIIQLTKPSRYREVVPGTLADRFVLQDLQHLTVDDPNVWLRQERLIQREYQYVDWDTYRRVKPALLEEIRASYPQIGRAAEFIVHYIDTTPPHIGLYAGTFSPFHAGHLNILQKAEQMFDKVIVLAGLNPEKQIAAESRAKLSNILAFHQVVFHDGLLTDYMNSLSYPVTLIRGLRTDTDFKKEEINLRWMQSLAQKPFNIIFIPCDKEYEHVSSSAIRMLSAFGTHVADAYLVDMEQVYRPRPK